jgi:hypothetical protein
MLLSLGGYGLLRFLLAIAVCSTLIRNGDSTSHLFAVYNKLSRYVDAKVTMDSSSLTPRKEILFLVIALRPILRNARFDILAEHLDTLKILLAREANPSEHYERHWRHARNYLHVEYKFSCGRPGSVHETWAHVVKLMLQHGADPYICYVGDGRPSWAELEQELTMIAKKA